MNTNSSYVGSSDLTAESRAETDRELLELAAKAAGVPGEYIGGDVVDASKGKLVFWNPLTDDGDALRLAVKLKLRIDRDHCTCCIAVSDGVSVDILERFESIDEPATVIQDDCSATRRAIVRAAAEIGRATA